jgi:SAM-dependent methyltransferase
LPQTKRRTPTTYGIPPIPPDTPDFGELASSYDELRPQDANWWELAERLVELGDLRGRRVLDAGTGTGAFAAALAERWAAKVWGVDPSPEMLEVARARVPSSVGLKQGWAEALPFRDGWFERVVMRLVAHLVDRPVAFAEAALPDGGAAAGGARRRRARAAAAGAARPAREPRARRGARAHPRWLHLDHPPPRRGRARRGPRPR